MAEDNFLDKKWEDRSTGGKILYGASAVLATPYFLANEARKMWQGDKDRLSEIDAAIAESEKSPYNLARVSKENVDYYNKVLGDYAKAKRESEYGFSPEEKAAARQSYAETTNLARQNALSAGGGNLAKYINANLNANQGQFSTQLAAQDAEVKRAKQQQALAYLGQLGSASQTFQDVQNLNFQKQLLAEQALGQAKTDWYTQRDTNRRALVQSGASMVGQAAGAIASGGTSLASGGTSGGTSTWTPPPLPKYTPITAPPLPSDIRLKQDIVFSHEENGHKIYEFSYKSEPNVRYSGVMAQEVLQINPSAVFEENGYYKVNYDMLGITMKKLN
jgi:hypothetical protein